MAVDRSGLSRDAAGMIPSQKNKLAQDDEISLAEL